MFRAKIVRKMTEKMCFLKECDIEKVGFYANRILETEMLNWLQRQIVYALRHGHSGEYNYDGGKQLMTESTIYVNVYGQEASIIQEAGRINQMIDTTDTAIYGSDLKRPIRYYNEEQNPIIRKALEIETKYLKEYGYENKIVLIPMPDNPPAPQPQFPALPQIHNASAETPLAGVHWITHEKPTELEIANYVLSKVRLVRIGERAFEYTDGYYRQMSDNDLDTCILKYAKHLLQVRGHSAQIMAVRKAILADDRIQVDSLGCENMVCLNNGILDLNSMTFMPHNPQYLFDYKLNVTWPANWGNTTPPTPVFDSFLQTASGGDPVWMRRALEIIGVILVNDLKTKKFYLLQGSGDSGKSVFGNLLRGFFDAKQVSAVSLYDFDGRFSMAAIAESKINLSMDMTAGTITEKSTSQLKMLTGGDMLAIEAKNKPIYSAYVRCSLLFGTNHRLKAASMNDPAFLRRICYLPFRYPVPPERQDRNLNAKLRQEAFGIFAKAVVAYKNLVMRGYEFSGDDVYAPVNAMAFGDQISDQDDMMDAFVSQCLVLNPVAFTPTDALFVAYTSFCNGQGIQDYNTFSKNLSNMLAGNAAVKPTRKRIGKENKRGYEGICLR